MTRLSRFNLLLGLCLCSGCLEFGEDWSTTTPNQEQIDHTEAYCALILEPAEYETIAIEWLGSGIDQYCKIQLRFTAQGFARFCGANGFENPPAELTRDVNAYWTMTTATNQNGSVIVFIVTHDV